MQRMAREAKDALVLLGPAFGDELEVKKRIGTVDFIADDGMADVGEVDAKLMEAACVGLEAEEGNFDGWQGTAVPTTHSQPPELGAGFGGFAALRIVGRDDAAAQPNRVFLGDAEASDGCVDVAMFRLDATGDEREVIFVDLAAHGHGAET